MSERRPITSLILVAFLVAGTLVAPMVAFGQAAAVAQDSHDAPADRPVIRQVVIVLAPYLRWEDLEGPDVPALRRLAEGGALGGMNVRSRSLLLGQPANPSEGALTMGAGVWAALPLEAPAAYSVDELYEVGTAAEAYRRFTGVPASGMRIVYLGLPATERYNSAAATLDVIPGTLGQAIVAGGGATAAVGNSDTGQTPMSLRRNRPAALLAMDDVGRVRIGDVSARMLREDPDEPFGVKTDMRALSTAYADAQRRLAQIDGPGLIVIDPGDQHRAWSIAPLVTVEVAEEHRKTALRQLDEVVRLVSMSVGEDTAVIVAPPVVDATRRSVRGLGPTIIAAPGWQGFLSSSSTQRTGIVTNLDVVATVTSMLGVDRPVAVIGNAMVPVATGVDLDERIDTLISLNATAVAIDLARPPVINGVIGATTIILLLSALVLLRARRWPSAVASRVTSLFRRLLLLVLAMPAASWLMFAFDPRPATSGIALAVFSLTTVLLWILGLVLEYRGIMRLPVGVLCMVTVGILLVDQWLGAAWSFTNFLGYSPLAGARYYGMGNEAAAIVVGAALIGSAFLLDQWPDGRYSVAARRWGLLVLGALVVTAGAAPFWGANVAVAIWGVVGFAILWAQLNGVRLDWKFVTGGFLVAVVLIAGFSLYDLAAGEGSQTHLGRAWESAVQGGPGELWTIVMRKVETNLRVLTRTNWSYLLIAVLGFLGFMRWRPQGDFAAVLESNPAFSSALTGCLIGGLAAYLTEDSGIVIPGLMALYIAVGILYLMYSRLGVEVASQPPDGRSR